MSQYTNQPRPDTDPINDPRNAILLRSDLDESLAHRRHLDHIDSAMPVDLC